MAGAIDPMLGRVPLATWTSDFLDLSSVQSFQVGGGGKGACGDGMEDGALQGSTQSKTGSQGSGPRSISKDSLKIPHLGSTGCSSSG